jgi:ADP-heptose:LPS heptosyltransferase
MRSAFPSIHLQGNESLLIILMGALGDLVRGFCLPGLIKSQYPEVHISWLVEPRWRDLVRHHDRIDRMLVFDRPRGVRALPALQRSLRRHAFDITLDLQRHFKSGLFSLLSGSLRRIGFHPRNAKEFNWIFNNTHIPYVDAHNAKLGHYLQFAKALGIDPRTPLDFGLAALATVDVRKHWAPSLPHPYVVMVMGSSWPSKDWCAAGYRHLLAHVLDDMGIGVALVGDGSQARLAREVSAGFTTDRLVDLTGRTTLTALTALLGQAAAALGPDSGPGHLAAAVHTPYVTLFGPTPPSRVVPYGCEDLAVQAAVDCAGCYRKRCPRSEHTCMRAITPAMVARQLTKALNRHSDPGHPRGRPVTNLLGPPAIATSPTGLKPSDRPTDRQPVASRPPPNGYNSRQHFAGRIYLRTSKSSRKR